MPHLEAQTVARAVVELWFTRFGCPVKPHCDEGKNFIFEVFHELCWIPGIEGTSKISFHPEMKARIRRTNNTLEESLSKYVDYHQHEWKKYFRLVLMAQRSSVQAVTNYRPFYVVLGTPLRQPIVCINETRQT